VEGEVEGVVNPATGETITAVARDRGGRRPRHRGRTKCAPGVGRDMSLYGLEDYTQIKHVMAKIDR
jgi:hypothetical protein